MINQKQSVTKALIVGLLLVAPALVSCQARETESRSLRVVYQSQMCRIQESGLSLLKSVNEFEALLSSIQGLGAGAAPVVDFSSHIVAVVAAGQKPSAGFQLRLVSNEAQLTEGLLTIDIIIDEPGDMAAAMISSPCMLLSFERAGVDRIKLVNGESSIEI
ncbi:MAG: protease complex subunit PrcB family protein [Pseudomonadales bacterium]